MNWKNRLTNYNFWISIASAALLILQAFKIEFDVAYINEILTGILGLLVVIGIISDPTRTAIKETKKESQNLEKQTEKPEETIVPIKDENESYNVYSQVDFQAVVDKISSDLNEISHKLETKAKTNVENLIVSEISKEASSETCDTMLENQLKIEDECQNQEQETAEETKAEIEIPEETIIEEKVEIQPKVELEIKENSDKNLAEQTEGEIPTHYNIVN